MCISAADDRSVAEDDAVRAVEPRRGGGAEREAAHREDLRARRGAEVDVAQVRAVVVPEPLVDPRRVVGVDLRGAWVAVERRLREPGQRRQDEVRDAVCRAEGVAPDLGHAGKLDDAAQVVAVVEAVVRDRRDLAPDADDLAEHVPASLVVHAERGVAEAGEVVADRDPVLPLRRVRVRAPVDAGERLHRAVAAVHRDGAASGGEAAGGDPRGHARPGAEGEHRPPVVYAPLVPEGLP